MAYTDKDWELVRNYFEAGLSLSDIISRDEVRIKAKSQISKRATREGWKRNDEKKQLINSDAEDVQRALEIVKKEKEKETLRKKETLKETFTETELRVHEELVNGKLS